MNYWSIFCVPFFTGIILCFVWSIIRKHNIKKESQMDVDDFTICYSPKWTFFMLSLSVVLMAILAIMNIGSNSNLLIDIIISIFIALFLFGAYSTLRESITIKNNSIVYTPVLGKTAYYQFSDITKIEIARYSNGPVLYYVYSDKRIFAVDSANAGANLFLKRVKQLGITIGDL